MARYSFRLQTVLRVRNAKRDQARGALAEAFHAAQVLADNRAQVASEQLQLRNWQRAAAAERYTDVNRLLEAQQYELVLRARQQEFARQESLLAIETERRRLVLVEAEREVRVLEMLDERHRRTHQVHERRRDMKQLDEVAAGISLRRRANEQ